MTDLQEILFPAKKDGKSGYINSKGQIVIDFEFDFFGSREFTEGLASILVNNKAGYIDTKGNFVIKPQFEMAMPFSEGLAYVSHNGKQGYIDKSGRFAIPPIYYSCNSFCDGYALVNDTVTSKGFFINKTGEAKLAGRNFLISEYREGLINCTDNKGNWGFIDIDGNTIINYAYKSTRPFYEGKAAVTPKKEINGKSNRKEKIGFINHQGELIIPQIFEGSEMKFSDGLCAIWNRDKDTFGYIDPKGEIVIPCELSYGDHFSEGMAAFTPKGRNKQYGYINKRGEVIIEPKFTSIESFENGLAEVIIGKEYESFLYGYVNKQGDYVWEPRR